MNTDRRGAIRFVGLSCGVALAGCFGASGGNGNGPETDSPSIASADSTPFSLGTSRPAWHARDTVGRVVVVDGEERERALFDSYDLPEERAGEIDEFRSGINYNSERLLLVESMGPNACYDRVEIDGVDVESDRISADAAVVDTSEGEGGCAQVITFPSALVRVTFDDEPIDAVAVEIRNGQGDTETVTSHADDPIDPVEPTE